MATSQEHRARLSVNVDPALRRQIKIAAAARDLSVRDFIIVSPRAFLALLPPGTT